MKKLKEFVLGYLPVLAIVSYAIIAVTSDIFANKMLQIGSLTMAGGILLVPFSFTIRDLMHRCVGFEAAKKIVWATAIVNLIVAALMILLDILPAAIPGAQETWHAVMGASWRVIIASFLAQLISDLADTYVFEAFTRKFGDKHTWLRVAVSNLASTPLDSVIFSFLAFYGVLPTGVIWASVVSSFVIKYVMSLIATPLAYLINKAEKAEH